MSTGRSYTLGQVVYKITLWTQFHGRENDLPEVLWKKRPRGLFCHVPGMGGAALCLFERGVHYEAASLAGLSSITAQYYDDKEDNSLKGFSLIEELPGVNSDSLFEERHNKHYTCP